MAAQIKAEIVGGLIQIVGDQWGETIEADQIKSRIAFYEKLRRLHGGRYAGIYGPTVDELKRIEGEALRAGLIPE